MAGLYRLRTSYRSRGQVPDGHRCVPGSLTLRLAIRESVAPGESSKRMRSVPTTYINKCHCLRNHIDSLSCLSFISNIMKDFRRDTPSMSIGGPPACKLPERVSTYATELAGDDHFVLLSVHFDKKGSVTFDLDYVPEPFCTDHSNSIVFKDLKRVEMDAIVKGEPCKLPTLTIEHHEDKDTGNKFCIIMQRTINGSSTGMMLIPDHDYVKLQQMFERELRDHDVMGKYTNPAEERIIVTDPVAQRVLAMACLHENYEQAGKRSLPEDLKLEKLANGLLNEMHEGDVNSFLSYTNCQIKTNTGSEALVETLLSDREEVVRSVVNGDRTASIKYFMHVYQQNENKGELLRDDCENEAREKRL